MLALFLVSVALGHCFRTAAIVLLDLGRFVRLAAYSRRALTAENLFLRKQVALFRGREVKPHRADDATRWLMAAVSRLFDWRMALVVVKPDALIGLLWRWKSKPTGRPRLSKDLRELIRRMAVKNPSWGQERIANELKLKLGIRVSPRTVANYLRHGLRRKPDPKQRWMTFVRNHAKAIVACDFFVVVTANFRILYVFVIMQLGTRRILHDNVTDRPTAERTLQQFREALPDDHPYRLVIHDRDTIFSQELDKGVSAMGVRVVRTPMRAPQANSICERFGETLRRECLDFLIPLNERHLKLVLKSWVTHFNHGRPHMSLGPGIPTPLPHPRPANGSRHSFPAGHVIRSTAVPGGLHHEYALEKTAA